MIPEYPKRVGIRLGSDQKERIQHLVELGLYKNASEVVRDALTRFLKEMTHE